jgi:hypothetical protein
MKNDKWRPIHDFRCGFGFCHADDGGRVILFVTRKQQQTQATPEK